MNPGVNAADGNQSEKFEKEDSLRTVECLRGRLLAERVASRNAKEEVEKMENKLIELEKKLIEECKSRNRAEKKLKFLMKKLQTMNIPYISCESEPSGSGSGSVSVERSEISSSVSSATSSSTKEVDDKKNNGNTREFIQTFKLIPVAENLQQSVCSSSSGNSDNPAAEKTNRSSDGPIPPQLTIQKEETEEFKEKKIESPIGSNNSEQNACSFTGNQDNPASQRAEEHSESSSISNNSEQNACSFAENQDIPASQIAEENSESLSISHNSEQNARSFAENQDNPASQIAVENSESSSISNNSEENPRSSAEFHDKSAAGEGSVYGNSVNFHELTMKIEIETESPVDWIKREQNASSSSAKDHDNPAATETVISRNSFNFPKLADVINESPTVSIESEQNACTNKQCQGSPRTQQEKPQSSQKPKKHDRSLRTLFKKEKLLYEENEEEQDEHQVDNSLALVPVDLPKPKPKQQSIDPEILDATVKEVLGSLRNAKEKLQTSMERRRSNMIKVG